MFQLDLIEHKIELFEAFSQKELQQQIEAQIENNKALMLEPYQVQHQACFHPIREKMLYTAAVHFRLKK